MTAQNPLDKIKHIVVVMFENRSFDHMLGYLYADQKNVSPLGRPFEGLTGDESNPDADGNAVKVFPIDAKGKHPYFMPGSDPGEGFLNTNSQLFGTWKPTSHTKATGQGFITDYASTLKFEHQVKMGILEGTEPSDIMGMYTPDLLPVLSGLAKGYAVCDRYHCSVPTETIPNRAFMHLATSQGILRDFDETTHKPYQYTAPSIFGSLSKHHRTWKIYGYDAMPLSRETCSDITHDPLSQFGKFKDFQADVASETLAGYTFLEPQWGSDGNSQHPNYDVSLGEQFLHDIYTTLHGSKLWADTLLIINFDEHGGCYDHVIPPANAVPPGPPPPGGNEYDFDFTRFGIRVPCVLVSPWIEAGTVFRPAGETPFDHTSILATIEAKWNLPPLTERDKAAPHMGGVLTLSEARTDDPIAGVTPPSSGRPAKADAAPSHLHQVHAGYLHHRQTGGKGPAPTFATDAHAKKYIHERERASEAGGASSGASG
ncbi:MAG: phosphoesterase [Planctomycetes bacterium]|nr:phosphoesterase [Planctomycetota bacterium]